MAKMYESADFSELNQGAEQQRRFQAAGEELGRMAASGESAIYYDQPPDQTETPIAAEDDPARRSVVGRLKELIRNEGIIIGHDSPPIDDEGGPAQLRRPGVPPQIDSRALVPASA